MSSSPTLSAHTPTRVGVLGGSANTKHDSLVSLETGCSLSPGRAELGRQKEPAVLALSISGNVRVRLLDITSCRC